VRKFALLTSAAALIVCAPAAYAEDVTPQSSPPPAEVNLGPVQWMGFAVSPTGKIFKDGPSKKETWARAAAKNECENSTSRTCRALSVSSTWNVSVVVCRGDAFIAGGGNWEKAHNLALQKAAGNGHGPDCEETYTYP